MGYINPKKVVTPVTFIAPMNASAPLTSSSSSSTMKYPATFFINSSMLASHQNRTVRLIGKVVQVSADGTRVQIESADGGIVNVTRSLVRIFPS